MTKEINFYLRKEENGEYSNFWRAYQTINNITFETNEHWYQYNKTENKEIQEWIRSAPSPFLAMKAGRSIKPEDFRKDWELIKVNVMKIGLMAKFSQNPELKEKLLNTGDAIFHEDSPNDLFWGKKGKDMLGKLIMKVRGELQLKGDEND